MKLTLIYTTISVFLFLCVGCEDALQPAENALWQPKEVVCQAGDAAPMTLLEDVEATRSLMEQLPPGFKEQRAEEFLPQQVLPQLNPWLQVGRGICRQEIGEMEFLQLAPLTDASLKAITENLYPKKLPHAFGILNKEFWEKIKSVQDEGLRVGFINPIQGSPVNGIYFSQHQVIALDVFSNPGTIHHEYRHHLQHEAVAPFSDQPLTALDRSCLRQVRSYLGELDATTIQIKYWLKTFNSIEPMSASESNSAPKFPQWYFLKVNLGYPMLASKWVKRSNCPEDLMDWVKKTAQATSQDQTAGEKALDLINRVGTIETLTQFYNDACEQNADSDQCASLSRRLEQAYVDFEAMKKSINFDLAQSSIRRQHQLLLIFDELPEIYRKDLCNHVGAYRLRALCMEIDEGESDNASLNHTN